MAVPTNKTLAMAARFVEFSRLKLANRPVWVDVVQRFPPLSAPPKCSEKLKVADEDLRKEFLNKFAKVDVVNLSETNKNSVMEEFIERVKTISQNEIPEVPDTDKRVTAKTRAVEEYGIKYASVLRRRILRMAAPVIPSPLTVFASTTTTTAATSPSSSSLPTSATPTDGAIGEIETSPLARLIAKSVAESETAAAAAATTTTPTLTQPITPASTTSSS